MTTWLYIFLFITLLQINKYMDMKYWFAVLKIWPDQMRKVTYEVAIWHEFIQCDSYRSTFKT